MQPRGATTLGREATKALIPPVSGFLWGLSTYALLSICRIRNSPLLARLWGVFVSWTLLDPFGTYHEGGAKLRVENEHTKTRKQWWSILRRPTPTVNGMNIISGI
jgi:hypothetical protein